MPDCLAGPSRQSGQAMRSKRRPSESRPRNTAECTSRTWLSVTGCEHSSASHNWASLWWQSARSIARFANSLFATVKSTRNSPADGPVTTYGVGNSAALASCASADGFLVANEMLMIIPHHPEMRVSWQERFCGDRWTFRRRREGRAFPSSEPPPSPRDAILVAFRAKARAVRAGLGRVVAWRLRCRSCRGAVVCPRSHPSVRVDARAGGALAWPPRQRLRRCCQSRSRAPRCCSGRLVPLTHSGPGSCVHWWGVMRAPARALDRRGPGAQLREDQSTPALILSKENRRTLSDAAARAKAQVSDDYLHFWHAFCALSNLFTRSVAPDFFTAARKSRILSGDSDRRPNSQSLRRSV